MAYHFEVLTPQHFAALESWFDDAATQRYLGGRDWLYREVTLMQTTPGVEFRGRLVQARYVWVVFEGQTPVALVDVEPYDDGTAGFAFVVAPVARGRGVGQTVLNLLDERAELRSTRALIGGVEPDNIAAHRCLAHAGFAIATEPDEEDMLDVERLCGLSTRQP